MINNKITLNEVRLNKFISHNTKYSRREADRLIKDGKVKKSNTVVTDLATKVIPNKDKIFINNKRVTKKSQYTLIVYNKPKGELVTKKDDRGRRTIYDTLPGNFKSFITVGRLDYNSTGLLILTDSVDAANVLMHGDWERTYYLKVKGSVGESVIEAMKNGLHIQDSIKGAHKLSKITSIEFAPFAKFNIIKNSPSFSKLKVTICEGKNRELRRFFGHFDLDIVDLKRVDFGGISLNLDKEGKFRFFSHSEYESIRDIMHGNELRMEKMEKKASEQR